MEIKTTRNTLLILILLAIPFLVFSKNPVDGSSDFYEKNSSESTSEFMPLTLQVLTMDVSCFGDSTGNAVAQPTDGTPPYSYAWSNGDTINISNNLISGNYSLTVTDGDGTTATENFTINQPDSLVVSAISIVGCEGGNSGIVEAAASGGISPYNYAWSTGDSTQVSDSLSTGIYFVTITDSLGCQATTSVMLEQPIEVNSNPSPMLTTCQDAADGAVVLDVWGGSGSYTFLWSNDSTTQNISGIPIGTYSVTVTDSNGCTSESETTILSPAPVNLNIQGISNVSCHGGADGAILVNAFGGSPGYTYEWSNGDTGTFPDSLTAGVYIVTITDAVNCTGEGTVIVMEPQALSTFLFTSPVCNGSNDGTATASVSGGTPPFDFLWSDGQTTQQAIGLSAGAYVVTVTDANNCSTEGNITINQNPDIFESNSTFNLVTCPTGNDGMASVTPSGAIEPYTYEWNTGSTDSVLMDLAVGTYIVTIYDFFNCSVTDTIEITEPDQIEINYMILPASCGLANGQIFIDPMGGTSPYTYEWFDGSTADSLTNLDVGIYAVNVTDANDCVRQFFIDVPFNNAAPTVITQDISITLNSSNSATIDVTQINNGSFDDCGIDTMYIDISNFDCSNIGENTVTLTVVDNESIMASSTATVTVLDTIAPTLTCPDDLILASCDSMIMVDYMLPLVDDNCPAGMPTLVSGIAPGEELFTGTTTTIYEYVDASGNTGTCSFDLTLETPQPIEIQLDSFTQASDGNSDGSIFITVNFGSAPYSYSWSDGNMIISDQQDLSGISNGDYFLTVTDANGCESAFTYELTTGIQAPELVQKVQLFPNPTADIFWVKIDFPIENNDRIQIFSLDGKLLLEKNLQIGEQKIEMNLEGFSNGIYTMQLIVNQGVVSKRILIQD